MGFFDDAWDTLKDAGKTVFGDNEDAGLVGTGQYKSKTHTIDPTAFTDPNSQLRRDELVNRRTAVDNRAAPTMDATKIGPATYANQVQAGPSRTATVGTLGAASRSPNAVINREDQQVRSTQMDLILALQRQAEGKGVGQEMAQAAFDTANDRNLKNAMAIAASRRGNTGNSLATIRDSTAEDRQINAAQLAQDKRQAVLDAQQQLAAVAASTRGQDIGVNTSQAGFVDAASARNQAAENQYGLARFDAGNTFALDNARRGDDLSKFDADLSARLGMFNAGETNKLTSQQADLDFKTRASNLEAYLKSQGMDDEMARYYTTALMDKEESDMKARQAYEAALTEQELGVARTDSAAFDASGKARREVIKGIGDSMSKTSNASGSGASGGK